MSVTLSAHIPLSLAVLCLESDCEAVFREGPDCCPACGSSTFVYLATWVGTGQLREEVDDVRRGRGSGA